MSRARLRPLRARSRRGWPGRSRTERFCHWTTRRGSLLLTVMGAVAASRATALVAPPGPTGTVSSKPNGPVPPRAVARRGACRCSRSRRSSPPPGREPHLRALRLPQHLRDHGARSFDPCVVQLQSVGREGGTDEIVDAPRWPRTARLQRRRAPWIRPDSNVLVGPGGEEQLDEVGAAEECSRDERGRLLCRWRSTSAPASIKAPAASVAPNVAAVIRGLEPPDGSLAFRSAPASICWRTASRSPRRSLRAGPFPRGFFPRFRGCLRCRRPAFAKSLVQHVYQLVARVREPGALRSAAPPRAGPAGS